MTNEKPVIQRPEGVTIIAVYFFLSAALTALGVCGIFFAMFGVLFGAEDATTAIWGVFGLSIGLVATFAGTLLSLIVGWGLVQLKSWARWGAIILAVFMLPGFPIFTVIGAAIIWYLWKDDVRVVFEGYRQTEGGEIVG